MRRGAPKPVLWIAGGVAFVAILVAVAARGPSSAPEGSAAPQPEPPGPAAAAPGTPPAAGSARPPAPAGQPAPAPGSQAEAPAPGAGGGSNAPASRPSPDDLPPGHPEVAVDEGSQVTIQWLGHACFYIHSPGGVAVVMDPFTRRATGLAPPSTGAHFVTVSADSPAHAAVEQVRPFQGESLRVIRGIEARRGDMRLVPVPTYRDDAGGAREGRNHAYVVEAGGMRIAHLGDLGHELTPTQLRALGPVDILLLPVGGDGLAPREAVAVAKQVNPRIVIPMAFALPDAGDSPLRLRPVQEFISASPYAVTAQESNVMLISKAQLPASTEIYTLRYQP